MPQANQLGFTGLQQPTDHAVYLHGNTQVKRLTTSWAALLYNELGSGKIIIPKQAMLLTNTGVTVHTFSLALLRVGDYSVTGQRSASPVITITIPDKGPRTIYNNTPLRVSSEEDGGPFGETYESPSSLVLEPGDVLIGVASANDAVNFFTSYLQMQ